MAPWPPHSDRPSLDLEMRGWKLGVLIAVVAVPLLPPIIGYLHNSAVIDDALGQLHMAVAPIGRPLDQDSRVSDSPEGCSAIAGQSFSTDRRRGALGLVFRNPIYAHGLAWSENGKPAAEWPIGTPTTRIEKPVRDLLDQWQIFDDGKQRFVLYQRIPMPNGLDPRCW